MGSSSFEKHGTAALLLVINAAVLLEVNQQVPANYMVRACHCLICTIIMRITMEMP
jgi:hypothetical protein